MASGVFPTTVYVSGFPAQSSRYVLLKTFGGHKGNIQEVQFINTPGESKKAFIIYSHASSVSLALAMNGKRIQNHSEVLDVREVDEAVLCEHLPGEVNPPGAAKRLQRVLRHVLDEKSTKDSMYELEISRLNQRVAEIPAVEELKRAVTFYKAEKERTEQYLTVQLTDARAQLEASGERALRVQAQHDNMCTSLAEAEARLKTVQELMRSQEYEMKVLQQRLDDAYNEKQSTIERLGEANNEVATLEEVLKTIKDERFEARSALWRTQSSLDKVDSRLQTAETRADNAEKKRKRAEEWLADEREAKRRLILDSRETEERFQRMAQEVESGYTKKLQVAKTLLEAEVLRRKEVEEQLAQATSRLDQSIVTDALLTAFIKMENWTVRLLGEEQEVPVVPSPSVSND